MTEADTAAPAIEARGGATRRRLVYAAPMVVFAGAAALIASRLGMNPESALVGKPVPTFSLPPVPGIVERRSLRRGLPGQRLCVLVRRLSREAFAPERLSRAISPFGRCGGAASFCQF
jgi:hypothetical protein